MSAKGEGSTVRSPGRTPGSGRRGYQVARPRSNTWLWILNAIVIGFVVIAAFLASTRIGHTVAAASYHFALYYMGVLALIALTAEVGIGLVALTAFSCGRPGDNAGNSPGDRIRRDCLSDFAHYPGDNGAAVHRAGLGHPVPLPQRQQVVLPGARHTGLRHVHLHHGPRGVPGPAGHQDVPGSVAGAARHRVRGVDLRPGARAAGRPPGQGVLRLRGLRLLELRLLRGRGGPGADCPVRGQGPGTQRAAQPASRRTAHRLLADLGRRADRHGHARRRDDRNRPGGRPARGGSTGGAAGCGGPRRPAAAGPARGQGPVRPHWGVPGRRPAGPAGAGPDSTGLSGTGLCGTGPDGAGLCGTVRPGRRVPPAAGDHPWRRSAAQFDRFGADHPSGRCPRSAGRSQPAAVPAGPRDWHAAYERPMGVRRADGHGAALRADRGDRPVGSVRTAGPVPAAGAAV